MPSTSGRRVVVPLVNRSGGTVIAGDVVVIGDGINDSCFTTTTTAGFSARHIGIAQETILSLATGRVLVRGYASLVNTSASVTRDHFLFTHSVAKEATASASRAAGSFGQVLQTGADPICLIWGIPDSVASLTVMESDGAPSVSSVDTIKFAGATVANLGSGDVEITIPSALNVTTMDGVPAVGSVDTIKFPNGSVVNLGSGDVSIRDVPQGFIGAKARGTGTTAGVGYQFVPFSTSEDWDTDAFHDLVTNPGRFTVPAGLGGKYLINYRVEHVNNAGGTYIRKNGAATAWTYGFSSGASNYTYIGSTILDLVAGDYIEIMLSVPVNGTYEGDCSITKLDAGRVGHAVGAAVTCAVTTTSLPNSVWTPVALDTEHYDTDGFHSNTVNNTRITIPAGLSGVYQITAAVHFANNPTGDRGVRVLLDGTTAIAEQVMPAGAIPARFGISTTLRLAAGAWIELQAWQSSGGALDTVTSIWSAPQLIAVRIDSGGSNYTGSLWGAGTAFPSGAVALQRFTRTDRGIDYYYDGTRWLSTQLHIMAGPFANGYTTGGAGAYAASGRPLVDGEDILLVDWTNTVMVLTTLDIANSWNILLFRHDGFTSTAVASVAVYAITGIAAGTYKRWTTAIGIVVSGTSNLQMFTQVGPTGSPGPVYLFGSQIRYRLIG